MSDIKAGGEGLYQGVNQQSTEISTSRGGRAPTTDVDLDQTNKYCDDTVDQEEEEEEESSEEYGDTEIAE